MKTIKNITLIALLLTFFAYTGCKKEDPQPKSDPLADRLEDLMNEGKSWQVVSVTKDGYDVTSQFGGFTLTISKYTYSTTNSLPSAWPTSGTWQFVDNNPDKILRDGNANTTLFLSGGRLTLTFSVESITSGRVTGLAGEYVFVMD